MKIATLFISGSYGTFISWCVYSFSELNINDEIISPIEPSSGSAHRFRKTPGRWVVTPIHNILNDSYTDYILIKYDEEKIINYVNNSFQKHYLGKLTDYFGNDWNKINNKLLDHWNDILPWQFRELLSFDLSGQIEFFKTQYTENAHTITKNTKNPNNFYVLDPELFLLNASVELEKLLDFFKLKKHKHFNTLEKYTSEYLNLQQHFTKNIQIAKFIENTINNISFTIPNLTIFDEAYIQHKLRSLGYEIKCYNLNEFPNNSTELFKLLK